MGSAQVDSARSVQSRGTRRRRRPLGRERRDDGDCEGRQQSPAAHAAHSNATIVLVHTQQLGHRHVRGSACGSEGGRQRQDHCADDHDEHRR